MAMRIEWNSPGFSEIMSSPEVAARVQMETHGMANRAGAGYGSSSRQVGDRYQGIVYPETVRAREDNAKNNTLLRVLG